jgi:hypothetical protein
MATTSHSDASGAPVPERIHGLASLIGNTPLLAIGFDFRGRRRTIYA